MWKFIVDVVHDFVSSLQPDVGRGFLHVSNVFLFWFDLPWGVNVDTIFAMYCVADIFGFALFAQGEF